MTDKPYDNLGDWSDFRQQALQSMTDMGTALVARGFDNFRLGEWLDRATGDHVRINYSGGEWRVVHSRIPRRPNGNLGTGTDAVECDTISIDLRNLKRTGKVVPAGTAILDGLAFAS